MRIKIAVHLQGFNPLLFYTFFFSPQTNIIVVKNHLFSIAIRLTIVIFA